MRGSMRLRVLAVGMAAVLCLGGLAGCSSGDAGKTSLSDTGAAEEVQKDEAAEAAEAARKAAEEAEVRAEAEAQAEAERQAEEAAAQAEAERIAAEEAARAEAEAQAAREAEEAAQAAAESDSYTVYITKTGEKYHRDGCRYLKKSKIAIDYNDARARGYDPCSVCNP